MNEGENAPISRAWILVGSLVVIAGLVAIVVLAGGGGESSGEDETPLDDECLEFWNESGTALGFGAHNASITHGYIHAEVTRLDRDTLQPDPDGECAAVFAAPSLDPEPVAAGMLRRNRRWVPLSALAEGDLGILAQLQSRAVTTANTRLEGDGSLTPLAGP